MKRVYLKVTTCKFVKGFSRGIVYDLNREKFNYIPLELVDFIKFINGKTHLEVLSYSKLSKEIINEYLQFIVDNEYAFLIPEPLFSSFPTLNSNFDLPGSLDTVVLLLDNFVNFDLGYYLDKFTSNGCRSVILCVLTSFSNEQWEEVIETINFSNIRDVQIVCDYIDDKNNVILESIAYLPFVPSSFVIYNAPYQKVIKVNSIHDEKELSIGYYTCQDLSFKFLNVDIDYFHVNVSNFTESRKYNLFFNRKLFIDNNGKMFHDYNFEHEVTSKIDDLSIFENTFAKQNKDTDIICSKCEYRYMCIDPRVPLLEGSMSLGSKCNFNPFICKWEGEEGYLTLRDCGVEFKKDGISVDRNRVLSILKKIY